MTADRLSFIINLIGTPAFLREPVCVCEIDSFEGTRVIQLIFNIKTLNVYFLVIQK